MNTEILGIFFPFILAIALAIPLGRYIAKVYGGDKTFLRRSLYKVAAR